MIKAILTDIEGTCTSLSFVKDTLFPYARERIAAFVQQPPPDLEIRKQIDQQIDTVRSLMQTPDATVEAVVAQLIRWIDQDNKATPLKAIQGYLWQEGYRRGDFFGHVYPDAYRKFKAWSEQGLRLLVFSSGSVKAQQLLFAHTEYGDLTPLFSGYFDTTTGAKADPESYRRIATQIGLATTEILFLSDIEAELDAAKAAGMHTICLQRESSASSVSKHPCHPDFTDIALD